MSLSICVQYAFFMIYHIDKNDDIHIDKNFFNNSNLSFFLLYPFLFLLFRFPDCKSVLFVGFIRNKTIPWVAPGLNSVLGDFTFPTFYFLIFPPLTQLTKKPSDISLSSKIYFRRTWHDTWLIDIIQGGWEMIDLFLTVISILCIYI